jgi:hypothetical protein
VAYDSLGGTAHQHVLKADVAVSRKDDQIGLTIVDVLDRLNKMRLLKDEIDRLRLLDRDAD